MTSEGEMPAGVLGDYFDLQRGATYKSALLGQPGPVLLGLASIQRNGGFRADNLRTYGGDSPEKLLLGAGDMYVSLKDVTQSGDLLGAVARVPSGVTCGRLTQDTVKLIPKPVAEPLLSYIFWLLRTPPYRAYCRQHAMGTTNLSMSRDAFLAYQVPPFTTARRQLIRVLEALDDKIDSSRRLSATLVEVVQAHFERAMRHSGASPIFLGELGTIRGGGTPSTTMATYWDPPEIVWATPKDTTALSAPVITGSARSISREGLQNSSAKLLPTGTVLYTSRATLGHVAIAGTPLATNQGFITVEPRAPFSSAFVFMTLRHRNDAIVAKANGSTFLEVNKTNFKAVECTRPSDDALAEFDSVASPAIQLVAALEAEAESLLEVRDALLPKLVSGQIRVPAEDADPLSLIA